MTELATSLNRESVAGFPPGAPGVTPPSNPDRRGVFLADVVVELGFGDQERINAAVQAATQSNMTLESYLLESGILDEDQLARAIAERNGLDHVDLGLFEADMEAADMIGRSAALRYSAVPIAFAADGALIVAVQEPYDSLGISDIEVMTRSEARPVIASGSAIQRLAEELPEKAPARRRSVPLEEEGEGGAAVPSESTDGAPAASPRQPVVPAAQAAADAAPPAAEEPVAEAPEAEAPEAEAPEAAAPAAEVAATGLQAADPQAEPPESTPLTSQGADSAPERPSEAEPPQPPPTPPAQNDSGAAVDLTEELRALQEAARRADALAAAVERRIGQLDGADQRAVALEADLAEAERRIVELEGRLAGVDAAADELRNTTERLQALYRTLEESVGQVEESV